MKYLAYDIRGIQVFIFAIPRLRYVIGGSALIDRFDRDVVPNLAARHNWTRISSAGGKGCFRTADDREADEIQNALVSEAHSVGVDIRFGRHADYSEAVQTADRLFPYLPEAAELAGHPCPESGLYPVPDGAQHRVVKRRLWDHGDRLATWFEQRLLHDREASLPPELRQESVAFFRDVDRDTPGHASLGRRSRWAIVCMDGNDMGAQFRHMQDAPHLMEWLPIMSRALDGCAQGACVAGLHQVLREWLDDEPDLAACRDEKDGALVLPLRPLVVGGDDIAVLCDARYADSFVSSACAAFGEYSRRYARQPAQNPGDLWPATGNALSISAGVLYAPVTLPLATAVTYAEALLANAKQHGRKARVPGNPAPACVDWESVTEGLIDHPVTRRQRELFFIDGDLTRDGATERVRLTRRPYEVGDFEALARFSKSELARLPRSITHRLLPELRAGFHDRQLFRARLGKHQRDLFDRLDESFEGSPPRSPGRWWREPAPTGDGWTRSTDLIDAVLLLQERGRLEQEAGQ